MQLAIGVDCSMLQRYYQFARHILDGKKELGKRKAFIYLVSAVAGIKIDWKSYKSSINASCVNKEYE